MERNYAIDYIKFFAILAVVLIHTFPGNDYIGYFILDNFSRFAVPFFFAASGYLFGLKVIHSSESTAYVKRYLIKILKIYGSWLLFYFIYDIIKIFISASNVKSELSKYMDGFTPLNLFYYGQGTSGYQLWFVLSLAWSIAVLYLFFRLKKITLLLVISLCLNVVGLFGQAYSIFYELPVSTRAALFIGIFYTTVGFWFAFSSPFKHSRKLNKKGYFYLFCFFTALQLSEGYVLEKVLHAKHGEYFLSTIFLTIFLFLFAFNNPQLGKGSWITKIGGNALGIYAIHVFFIDMIDILFKTIGLKQSSHHLFLNMTDAFLVFTLSYLSYQLIQSAKKVLVKNLIE
jgi:surface polysaccharide O-acyltransferase-like enzyme